MTNQEADQIIVRVGRQSLRRSFLRAQINGSAVFAVGFLASFAFLAGEPFTACLLLVLLAAILLAPIAIKFQNYKVNREIAFWELVRKQGFSGKSPADDTKLLIDKIIRIQTATPNEEILTTRQAVKLLDAYERQAQQLQKVKARLSELGTKRDTINAKIKQLQALGENHSAGLQSLERARADFDALQNVAREIQGSCERLEAILDTARKTAKTRQLQRELDQLSAVATPDGNAEFDAESSGDLERQISREIEMYLQLERETEQQLR